MLLKCWKPFVVSRNIGLILELYTVAHVHKRLGTVTLVALPQKVVCELVKTELSPPWWEAVMLPGEKKILISLNR